MQISIVWFQAKGDMTNAILFFARPLLYYFSNSSNADCFVGTDASQVHICKI